MKAKEWAERERKKEEFRHALLRNVFQINASRKSEGKTPEEILLGDDGQWPEFNISFAPTPEDLGLLRYHFYAHRGIEPLDIPPMQKLWMNHIWQLIHPNLIASHPKLSEDLELEVHKGFNESVKYATVSYVLRDPNEEILPLID